MHHNAGLDLILLCKARIYKVKKVGNKIVKKERK